MVILNLHVCFHIILGRNVSLVFMIYNPSSEMKARTGDHPENVNMSKKVVLASIFPQPKFLLTKPVVITIQQPMVRQI